MPYKADANRRHKIPKATYRVTNWPEQSAISVKESHALTCLPDRVAGFEPPGGLI